jgi:TetR/AcrR family transcriptional repressor of nem operon
LGQTAAETAWKHEQILDESIRLFRERGFAGVSVGQVMQAAGLTHGPFYNHFASKEALMAECLTRSMQRDTSGYDKYPATEKGLAQYIGEYLSLEHRDDPSGGCNVAALAAEVRQHEELRESFTMQLKGIIQKLATHFPWRSRRSARGDAIHLFAAMVGAMILARAVSDQRFAKEILDEVRQRVS